jgi:hypothetical protein
MTPNGNNKMARVGRPGRPVLYGIGKLFFSTKRRANPWSAIVRITDTQQIEKVFPTQEDAIKWIKSFVNQNLSS